MTYRQSRRTSRIGVMAIIGFCLLLASCGGGRELPQSQPRPVDASEDASTAQADESDRGDDQAGESAQADEGAQADDGDQANENAQADESDRGDDQADQESADAAPDPDPNPEPAVAAPVTDDSEIVVDVLSEGIPLDRRLLGINLPAWIRPRILADPIFQQGTIDSGASYIRLPGGSWSNAYDWLGCETADVENCWWLWASRPTDWIDFMQVTDLEAMWTVSINDTAQKSAAVVAFFNGDVDDATVIGVDRDGVDWGVVGDWAQLRATNGNPDPVGIALWEVGNEVYGGRPGPGGEQCASFGWEDVWTCDGTEYAVGVDDHDGALAIRQAMLAVDPTIDVGLVGVSEPTSWTNWGTEVITAAGDDLDMYVVHGYGFDQSPTPEDALGRAAEFWPQQIADARTGLPPGAELAFTEYNLVSFEAGDTEQAMTRNMNAFFLADSIGQLAVGEVDIATWWNLANGITGSGTDYGLMLVEAQDPADEYRRAPTFEAFAYWGRTGTSLLDVPVRSDDLRVYPTRHDDGRLTMVAINLGAELVTTDLVIEGLTDAAGFDVVIESVSTDDLTAQELDATPAASLGSPDGPISLSLAPWSISLIEVRPIGS